MRMPIVSGLVPIAAAAVAQVLLVTECWWQRPTKNAQMTWVDENLSSSLVAGGGNCTGLHVVTASVYANTSPPHNLNASRCETTTSAGDVSFCYFVKRFRDLLTASAEQSCKGVNIYGQLRDCKVKKVITKWRSSHKQQRQYSICSSVQKFHCPGRFLHGHQWPPEPVYGKMALYRVWHDHGTLKDRSQVVSTWLHLELMMLP